MARGGKRASDVVHGEVDPALHRRREDVQHRVGEPPMAMSSDMAFSNARLFATARGSTDASFLS